MFSCHGYHLQKPRSTVLSQLEDTVVKPEDTMKATPSTLEESPSALPAQVDDVVVNPLKGVHASEPLDQIPPS